MIDVLLAVVLIAYAFGLGGSVGAVIFLAILFVGGLLRVMRPLLELLRA